MTKAGGLVGAMPKADGRVRALPKADGRVGAMPEALAQPLGKLLDSPSGTTLMVFEDRSPQCPVPCMASVDRERTSSRIVVTESAENAWSRFRGS